MASVLSCEHLERYILAQGAFTVLSLWTLIFTLFLSHLPLNHRAIAMCITFVHCWLAFCHAANKRRFDWALPNMCWCAAKKLLTRTVAQPNQTSWLPNVVDLQLRSWVWTRFPCAYWLLIDNVSSNKPLLTVLLRQYSIIGDEIDNLHISSLSTLLVPLL